MSSKAKAGLQNLTKSGRAQPYRMNARSYSHSLGCMVKCMKGSFSSGAWHDLSARSAALLPAFPHLYSSFWCLFTSASSFRMSNHRRLPCVTLDASTYFPKSTRSPVPSSCTRYASKQKIQKYSHSFLQHKCPVLNLSRQIVLGKRRKNNSFWRACSDEHLSPNRNASLHHEACDACKACRKHCSVSNSWEAKRFASKISVFPVLKSYFWNEGLTWNVIAIASKELIQRFSG